MGGFLLHYPLHQQFYFLNVTAFVENQGKLNFVFVLVWLNVSEEIKLVFKCYDSSSRVSFM